MPTSGETIYSAIYALPVGELRKELIICLRQSKTTRRPRSGGVDLHGQTPEMVSIQVRPPEIEARLMLAPERNLEHSIRSYLDHLKVRFMERLRPGPRRRVLRQADEQLRVVSSFKPRSSLYS